MSYNSNSKCAKCRRAGEKLFLKGDRCFLSKCAMVRKSYPPGIHTKTNSRGLSEYGKQLSIKQKVKRIYGVLEKQFRKHFQEIKNKPGISGDLLLERLEKRLDNVVFRLGFAVSRSQARQLVNHGFFLVNQKKVNIPSYELRINDTISVRKNKQEKKYFQQQKQILKNKRNIPSWLKLDSEKLEGKILSLPQRQDVEINVDLQVIVEYYSR